MTTKNMRRTLGLTLALALLSCSCLIGETLVQQNSTSGSSGVGLRGNNNPFSLFDPSRFQMQQSYSMSYSSAGGKGQMIAMYLNQVDYHLTRSLTVTVAMAWLHQPQSLLGVSRNSGLDSRLLPNFRLDWRPSEKFHFSVGYESLLPYFYNDAYSPYRRYESIFEQK